MVVFREESEGAGGLKKTQRATKTKYKLAFDHGKKSTRGYSPGRMEFDNYVIDSKRIVRAKIDGTKTTRAKAAEFMRVLNEIEEKK